MENKYGQANRIWVMDRGMVSAENIEFLNKGGRRYILGTPKSMLGKFEARTPMKDSADGTDTDAQRLEDNPPRGSTDEREGRIVA